LPVNRFGSPKRPEVAVPVIQPSALAGMLGKQL